MERKVMTMEEIYLSVSKEEVEFKSPQPKPEPKPKPTRVYPSLSEVKEEVMKELREITRGGDLEGLFEDDEDEDFEIEYSQSDEVFEDEYEDEITSNADFDEFTEILEKHLSELDLDAANASEVYEGYVNEMEELGLNYLSEDEFMTVVQTDYK